MRYINLLYIEPVICFGKFKGEPLRSSKVDTGYLRWVLETLPIDDSEASAVRAEVRRRQDTNTGRNYNDYRNQYNASPPPSKVPDNVTLADILEVIGAGRRTLAQKHHPDIGGSHTKMVSVNSAADFLEEQARLLLKAK